MYSYKRILFPTDGSSFSRAAIPHAASLARAYQAHVTVVTAVDPLSEAVSDVLMPVGLPERRQLAESRARDVAAELRKQGAALVDARVLQGHAAAQIVEVARAERADLIVIAAHGGSSVARTVLGSVADAVVHEAPCPVMVVHPRE